MPKTNVLKKTIPAGPTAWRILLIPPFITTGFILSLNLSSFHGLGQLKHQGPGHGPGLGHGQLGMVNRPKGGFFVVIIQNGGNILCTTNPDTDASSKRPDFKAAPSTVP